MRVKPIRRKKPRAVTLIIGIIAHDSVIMACDSQITAGQTKRTDGTKLKQIGFGKLPVLVAQAGSLSHTNRFLDVLSKQVKSTTPKTAVEAGEMIQEAMRKFRTELSKIHFNCASDELATVLSRLEIDCNFLFGFCLSRRPYLISIAVNDPVYHVSETHFEADGTGALLGSYLLNEHTTPDMSRQFASTMAVYVVEVVKKYDLYCSGSTIVGHALPPGGIGGSKGPSRVKFLSTKAISEYADWVLKAEATTRIERNRIIHREFAKQDAAMLRIMESMSKDLPPLTAKDIEQMTGEDDPDYPIEQDENPPPA